MKKKVFRFKTLNILSEQARILQLVGRGNSEWVELKASGSQKARRRFSQTLSVLSSKKDFLEIKREENRILAKLTPSGVLEFWKLQLILVDELPEGLVCLVTFDIPEKFSDLRDVLRLFLKENCFFPFQKSVWISPFDMVELLNNIFVAWKIEKWVRVFVAYEGGVDGYRVITGKT
jgi:hypothetical protein